MQIMLTLSCTISNIGKADILRSNVTNTLKNHFVPKSISPVNLLEQVFRTVIIPFKIYKSFNKFINIQGFISLIWTT